MGYHIINTDYDEFRMDISDIQGRERFLEFARKLMEDYISYLEANEAEGVDYGDRSSKDAREAYEELWGNVRDFDDTLGCLKKFLEEFWGCPFRFETLGTNKTVWFEFDYYGDDRWHEDDALIFIKAFARYAKEGAYVGLEGEDNALWSYVFDGEGDYQLCFPAIDWRRGYQAPPAPTSDSPWMAAHLAWESFREEHPNLLSDKIALANAVYYMRPNPGWEEHPDWFEGLCWAVWKVGEEKGASPQCVIDAAEKLIEEGRLKTEWLGEDLMLVIDALRVGVEEEKR